MILFTSVLLVILGYLNLIHRIAAVGNSHAFTAIALSVLASPRTWRWVTLIISGRQLPAAAEGAAGNPLARWLGVVVRGLDGIDQMLFIPAYPFRLLMIIAMAVVALYGLCAKGSHANVEAAA